ncbi:cyclic-di-AMP-binding protein CbpB [Ornithinibacillus halotolerans]|uniref:CBS domain-containing protein n=1 Tax=Ornithinibacillus halotolerans TaxID=1274357 RepID=A0A916WCT7_9BACI|nr:cyclic-di-AMP-binding protein CbpB [Ornithinibacillus halotolerans]GGA87861.1 CBS domain-containing protein [Ornithinibacillus halotolerans]
MSLLQDKELTAITIADIMIPAEKVAHVQENNPLEHALLVLVKSGYSAVPVLDSTYKLKGTIGKTRILNEILGLERFEIDLLSDLRVQDVMITDIPRLLKEDTLIDGLKASIDYPFVCVVDKEGYFDGILTRRAILKEFRKDFFSGRNKQPK